MSHPGHASTGIRAGTKTIGGGAPCFIAAEIGINHNGDLDLARRSIDAAAMAGADAVKFQNYRTEDFISDRTLVYEYVSRGERVVEPQYDMFKRCELSGAAVAELKAHCDAKGVVFFSTPTGEETIADLVRCHAPLLKNGSDYLGNLPVIRSMARTGIPTILSTGMATLSDIDQAVDAFYGAGGRSLVLLVCTSAYPTKHADAHLRRIESMQAAFGVPVGFSDHTEGIVAAVAAVALGACFVEKHFTIDRSLPGPDHRFSSDAAEMKDLVTAIRAAEASLGVARIGPTSAERDARAGYRLSCVSARALAEGTVLGESDLAFRRPGNGLPPAAASWILGRRLRRAVPAGHVLAPEDFG